MEISAPKNGDSFLPVFEIPCNKAEPNKRKPEFQKQPTLVAAVAAPETRRMSQAKSCTGETGIAKSHKICRKILRTRVRFSREKLAEEERWQREIAKREKEPKELDNFLGITNRKFYRIGWRFDTREEILTMSVHSLHFYHKSGSAKSILFSLTESANHEGRSCKR